ncbi:MAG: hypothetical protein ABF379_01865, partial [Akkermansiaceae bacterium]
SRSMNDFMFCLIDSSSCGVEPSSIFSKPRPQTSAEELKKSHDKMLTGDILAPETMLDPETWEPVATEQ